MGASLMRGKNTKDVYHASLPSHMQLNLTLKHSPVDLHHKLGHPSTKVFKYIVSMMVLKSNSLSNFHCYSRSINKCHKLPFGPNLFFTNKPLPTYIFCCMRASPKIR